VPSSHRLAVLALVVPLALAACSSGTGGGTTSPTSSSPVSPTGSSSPTDSGSGSTTGSSTPTGTASVSPSAGGSTSPGGSTPTPPRPEGNPSTVAPPPSASGVQGVSVVYTPTTAAKGQKVSILATTDASLAGKPVYIVKMNDGAPRVISTGSVVGSAGLAKTYAVLQRTGVLKLVIPAKPLTGKPDAVGSYPLDPSATLLAQSAEFTVTIA